MGEPGVYTLTVVNGACRMIQMTKAECPLEGERHKFRRPPSGAESLL